MGEGEGILVRRLLTGAIALGLVLLGLGVAGVPGAHGAKAGRNGWIAFRRYLNKAQTRGALASSP
jgi:hypothetical protein